MLKRAMDCLVLAAIWMTTPTAVSPQEPFRPVQGSGLSDRLTNAVKQADLESPGKSFWTAYNFDIKNGVAVGISPPSAFQGKAARLAGTQVLYGTLNGVPVSSRVALFSLHPARSESVTRSAIYNLDEKQRPSDNYPVYWLGHANKDEAFNDALRLAESGQSTDVRAPATLALSLQEDLRVNETLKGLVSKTTDAEVRAIGIASLGQVKTNSEFLADVARQDSSTQAQIEAIQAIARNKSGDTFARLRSVYRPDLQPSVKMALINAIANQRDKGGDKDAAAAFLLDLEQHDPAPEIRQHAIYTLGNFGSSSTIDELMRRFQAETDESSRNQIIYALAQMKNQESLEKLFEIARDNDDPRLRRHARFWIQDRIRQRVTKAEWNASDGKPSEHFEAEAERIIKEQSSSEAVSTLMQIAKTNPNLRVRMNAINFLFKLDDPRVVEFYHELLSTN